MLRDPRMAALTGSTAAMTGEASGSNGPFPTMARLSAEMPKTVWRGWEELFTPSSRHPNQYGHPF